MGRRHLGREGEGEGGRGGREWETGKKQGRGMKGRGGEGNPLRWGKTLYKQTDLLDSTITTWRADFAFNPPTAQERVPGRGKKARLRVGGRVGRGKVW